MGVRGALETYSTFWTATCNVADGLDGIVQLQTAYNLPSGMRDRKPKLILAAAKVSIVATMVGFTVYRSVSKGSLPYHISNLIDGTEKVCQVAQLIVGGVEIAAYEHELSEDVQGAKAVALATLILKIGAQLAINTEKGYLQAYESSGGTAQRPISMTIGRYVVYFGSIPINPTECNLYININTFMIALFDSIRTASKGFDDGVVAQQFNRLYTWSNAPTPEPEHSAQPEHSAEVDEFLEERDECDTYCCTICFNLPKDPVMDPNGVQIYDRANIEQAIAANHKSPFTKAPLNSAMLIELPATRLYLDTVRNWTRDHWQRVQENEGAFTAYMNSDKIQKLRAAAEVEKAHKAIEEYLAKQHSLFASFICPTTLRVPLDPVLHQSNINAVFERAQLEHAFDTGAYGFYYSTHEICEAPAIKAFVTTVRAWVRENWHTPPSDHDLARYANTPAILDLKAAAVAEKREFTARHAY